MADVFPEVGQVVLTSLLSLTAMFIFTRAGGKRQIAQMSPFDYLNAVTVGSIGAELATNLEQWWRPFSALIVYGLVSGSCTTLPARATLCAAFGADAA